MKTAVNIWEERKRGKKVETTGGSKKSAVVVDEELSGFVVIEQGTLQESTMSQTLPFEVYQGCFGSCWGRS